MRQTLVLNRTFAMTGLVTLYLYSGCAVSQETKNPWLEPRVGPAETRSQASDINTWSEGDQADEEDPESSIFPPMDEDTVLGTESYPMIPPTADTPITSGSPTYTPSTEGYVQNPGSYGYESGNYQYYGAPYSGYSNPYPGYQGYGYRGYGPGNFGNMWPGGYGGMWPGGGFPFGGSGWMPF